FECDVAIPIKCLPLHWYDVITLCPYFTCSYIIILRPHVPWCYFITQRPGIQCDIIIHCPFVHWYDDIILRTHVPWCYIIINRPGIECDIIIPLPSLRGKTAMEELTMGTSIETGVNFPKDNETSLSQTGNLTFADRPALTTSQVSPLTSREDTTTASLQLTTVTTTTIASTTTTARPATTTTTQPITETPTTTTTRRTTTTTTTTAPASRRTLSPPIPKTKPRGTTTSLLTPFPFTTTMEAPPRQCNVTEKIWVKTILTIHVRRNRLDSIQRQNLRRGLTQALRRALNDTTAQAQ
ncbi:unnamed protein product, partial [Coregonus sp. 'balchen']